MVSSRTQPITELLARWNDGDAAAREELIPLLYQDLRQLARRTLASRRAGHTLQSTALVHEAYLRLAGPQRARWQSREHFFAVAARAMRHILVDHARRRQAGKRGGGRVTLTLDESVAPAPERELDLVALDDALGALAALDPAQSQLVELRFFGGLSIEAAARVMGISPATVKREWATARSWLYAELQRRAT
jgi:RNA polymerase sigma factor (TIGR02999 family)